MRSQLLGTNSETYTATGLRDRRFGADHPRRLRWRWAWRYAIADANSGVHSHTHGNPHSSADRGAHRDAYAITHAHARPVAVRGRSRPADHRYRSTKPVLDLRPGRLGDHFR